MEQISIENWYLRVFRPEEDKKDREDEKDEEFYSRYPYPESKMEAFENAGKRSESIPSKEKEN